MDEQRWNEARRLFEAALDVGTTDRDHFLTHACPHDDELRELARRMIAADAEGHALLDSAPPSLSFLGAADPVEPAPPARAGAYRLLEEVGRGGMGIVYRAERADGAFERAVALKVIRGGIDSGEVLDRFRAERRILGQLEHPNVARLYDAGVADDGRPYIVMELVEGERIDRYCEAHELGVRARVRLFTQVCDAVQHAHRSLVIHRDLKPSNVLVRDDGSVKLLDFGIARLTAVEPDAAQTRTGHRLFTPEYASPEQIRGEPLTTGSDVYSLGALLYELLAGRRPFENWADAAAYALHADERTAPDAPSRATTRWRRMLQGDLDRILLRSLACEPTDRYPSVESFAGDLRRYLGGLPVSARPPSPWYRARKFVRRHRTGVAAAALVVLAIGLAAATTARQARIAAAERDAALGVSGFLEDLFQASDPRVLSVQDTTRMIDFLDATGERVRTGLADQPRTHARMLLVLGTTYRNMGRNDRAEPLLRDAIEANALLHGERHEDVAEARRLLGLLLAEQDRHDEAIPTLHSALATQQSLTGERSWEVARLREAIGQALLSAGQPDRALPHVEASLAIRREVLEPDDPVITSSLNTLAALKSRQGHDDEAIPLFREAIELSLRLPNTVPEDIGVQRMNLAMVYMRTGRSEEALEQARLGHEILATNVRPQVVARSRARLAEALAGAWSAARRTGAPAAELDALAAETDSLFRSGIDLMRTLPEYRDARFLLHAYARFLQSAGDLPAAESAMREALDLAAGALGTDHVEANQIRAALAGILVDRHLPAQAEPLARRSRDGLARDIPPAHPAAFVSTVSLARALIALGRSDEALPMLDEAHDLARVELGDEHPLTLELRRVLALARDAATD